MCKCIRGQPKIDYSQLGPVNDEYRVYTDLH